MYIGEMKRENINIRASSRVDRMGGNTGLELINKLNEQNLIIGKQVKVEKVRKILKMGKKDPENVFTSIKKVKKAQRKLDASRYEVGKKIIEIQNKLDPDEESEDEE
ncbi:MAG: hypothetical protein US50_C0002G0027 [Candidatus Nomurabacteria bacterium GW2011_GWB1_37_5]|uniref:Uncharacterized protein n=1 Tax=Candidatus Nomurabacteria bacterium GW2011_GWB1_37_5 TaxID=1618742 RepID=A0A0G0H193_9BACT|nr:MAG: hypothetical protein US50_C0002G0027 [Candidatus Nomurabacteria bacterium GW2011_GWB1_37_5]